MQPGLLATPGPGLLHPLPLSPPLLREWGLWAAETRGGEGRHQGAAQTVPQEQAVTLDVAIDALDQVAGHHQGLAGAVTVASAALTLNGEPTGPS